MHLVHNKRNGYMTVTWTTLVQIQGLILDGKMRFVPLDHGSNKHFTRCKFFYIYMNKQLLQSEVQKYHKSNVEYKRVRIMASNIIMHSREISCKAMN
jgi:hypothetical protein